MKRPAFLSGFLMMLVGLGLTIAVMFVLPFHKDAAAPCFYLVRMTAVLGFASALRASCCSSRPQALRRASSS